MPVLSELIAEVEPSVSTERSCLTIACAFASCWVPYDRIVVMTAGRPLGMADTANAIAVTNSVSNESPRMK